MHSGEYPPLSTATPRALTRSPFPPAQLAPPPFVVSFDDGSGDVASERVLCEDGDTRARATGKDSAEATLVLRAGDEDVEAATVHLLVQARCKLAGAEGTSVIPYVLRLRL